MAMSSCKRWMMAALLPMALSAGVSVQAQTQSPRVHAKQIVSEVCASCHGADGNSSNPAYPSLAQQGAAYLYDQLTQFAAQGHRRASGVMGAMAVHLSAPEMRSLADYFSHQALEPAAPVKAQLAARGASIYLAGIAGKNIPACASCHGLRAEGLPPAFPRLAGQHAEYVDTQLRQFRAGSRASDADAMMRTLAARLSDAEMNAVAQYVANLR
jgi:cytochrome c553